MIRILPLLALIAAAPALAVPTPVTVRVISQGAKFIGTGMGGVEVTLADAATGAPLASGRIEGGTGDTAKIMPGAPRGTPQADDKTAKFDAMIDIDAPRAVLVTVKGPLKPAGVAVTASASHWLLPGQPVVGDGWVLELRGLALTARREGGQVVADVSMLCGCPIAPGTLWDESRFRLNAWVGAQAVPLKWAGQTGRFAAEVPAGASWVTAVDTLSGATSAAKISP
ncbi:hypothetical protein CHU93_13135 [Sandarakinorhabdus cyanobacteriorum]|uniref:Uncharacterized protein n=1 Tax=Sandarakinorhabdus cyanobacteriorum TaxID=1981098 RepID=A0A255YB33_9SPHN|nr:hypothetical protein [Sandarakinorhabdus cyanobacteriorum]OYQ25670.1 hypothetical protein CHU93_13135 [Sandarakinorhabdus cyanobacteriorum]